MVQSSVPELPETKLGNYRQRHGHGHDIIRLKNNSVRACGFYGDCCHLIFLLAIFLLATFLSSTFLSSVIFQRYRSHLPNALFSLQNQNLDSLTYHWLAISGIHNLQNGNRKVGIWLATWWVYHFESFSKCTLLPPCLESFFDNLSLIPLFIHPRLKSYCSLTYSSNILSVLRSVRARPDGPDIISRWW